MNKIKKISALSSLMLATVSIILTGCERSVEVTVEAEAQNKTISTSAEKPNIVWLISEDNSKHYLKLYDDSGAQMPNIEKLATKGLIFDNAFANTPVCSTARSTLATGLYSSRLGTLHHRTYQQVSLPKGLKPLSLLLKQSGYYTTNNVKTDYNFENDVELWSESSNEANWRNKAADQPFFHVQTFAITHEGKLHFKKGAITNQPTKHDPKKITLAPMYPDTPTFRYTHARTLDNHQKADNQMGTLIAQLEQDGELENTFIFYFGDHGGVLPASKGYVFERGLSVPLVVRVPENFKHLVGEGLDNPNTRVSGLVSFIDFAPSVLDLAGLEKPAEYPGQSFLSPDTSLNELNKRDIVFGQADRFDEKSDLVRSVRKGNFKYIRNYQPYYPDALQNNYRYKQLAYQEWRQLFKQGKLTPQQAAFFESKSAEMLFDLSVDPYEMNNLAGQENYNSTLMQLRNVLQQQQQQHPDLGFIVESKLVQSNTDNNLYDYGKEQHQKIQRLIEVADLQLQPYATVATQLKAALTHTDDDVVYRGLISLTSFAQQGRHFAPVVKKLLNESQSIPVRSRALEFLTLVDDFDATKVFASLYQSAEHDLEKVELLNIAALLKEQKGFVFNKPIDLEFIEAKRNSQQGKVNVRLKVRWDYISQAD